jgi:hypothetical protein
MAFGMKVAVVALLAAGKVLAEGVDVVPLGDTLAQQDSLQRAEDLGSLRSLQSYRYAFSPGARKDGPMYIICLADSGDISVRARAKFMRS